VLDRHLTVDNLAVETEYLAGGRVWERPYGWGWVLALAAELGDWSAEPPQAASGESAEGSPAWQRAVDPRAERLAELCTAWLDKADYPTPPSWRWADPSPVGQPLGHRGCAVGTDQGRAEPVAVHWVGHHSCRRDWRLSALHTFPAGSKGGPSSVAVTSAVTGATIGLAAELSWSTITLRPAKVAPEASTSSRAANA